MPRYAGLGGVHGAAWTPTVLATSAAAGTARAYYHIMYPWFGARPAAGQLQWRFELNVPRPARASVYDRFMFYFQDGTKTGTILCTRSTAP